ncbi:hypothetical protein B0H66DRAFT_199697 [Apodospora peruviana]|uniref:Uncharacterized protein n=1 Tax=Apodospora peruviana TaxID=516989 RepID=A0AAE0IC24_9PEZI|nr:hypothetical protein B0H66DRAFT_199697 [Apodospora peruviana]
MSIVLFLFPLHRPAVQTICLFLPFSYQLCLLSTSCLSQFLAEASLPSFHHNHLFIPFTFLFLGFSIWGLVVSGPSTRKHTSTQELYKKSHNTSKDTILIQ